MTFQLLNMNLKKSLTSLVFILIILSGTAYYLAFENPQALNFFKKAPFIRSTSSENIKETTKQSVVEEESSVIKVVEETSPAVVSVVAKVTGYDFFSGPYTEESGIGTGFIVRKDGLIFTNKHVVDDERLEYSVALKNGKEIYPVKEIVKDPTQDFAIIKIEADNLTTVDLGDSDSLKVGQTVIAIGNALGRFTNTVTKGVVSGLGRGIEAGGGGFSAGEYLDDVIQTDAALNPGNSGGPLVNLAGQVIGINVAISASGQSIGFAVPINSVKKALTSYEEKGKITRPLLGVSYMVVDQSTAKLRNIPQGAFVQEVIKDSAAENAGIRQGDIITKINGKALADGFTLAGAIRGLNVGDDIKVAIYREGETIVVSVKLGEAG